MSDISKDRLENLVFVMKDPLLRPDYIRKGAATYPVSDPNYPLFKSRIPQPIGIRPIAIISRAYEDEKSPPSSAEGEQTPLSDPENEVEETRLDDPREDDFGDPTPAIVEEEFDEEEIFSFESDQPNPSPPINKTPSKPTKST
jgi:hypothetical protein